MLKKDIRSRKEYLFKMEKELTEKMKFEKKQKLQNFIKEGKSIPGDLKGETELLLKEIQYEDDNTKIPNNIADDEYFENRFKATKILVTTSRSPSQRLTQFLKEMRLILPNCIRVNRGNVVVKDLVEVCKKNDFTDLIILHENRGQPDGMIISHMPMGPTAYFGLANVVLRHDIKEGINKISESFPHLIFDNFSSKLGLRLSEILQSLFPPPKPDFCRVITFANRGDFISFRHHTFNKSTSKNGEQNVELEELGPRFEMRPFQVMLGTVDQKDSKKEWSLRNFIRTAGRKENL